MANHFKSESTLPTEDPNQQAHQSAPSLTNRTARGFTWMLAQTAVTKSFDTVAHLILGRLLLGEEWGVIGLAMTVRVFTDVLRRTGLRQILVQRHLKFDRWATPGFWMALAIGGLAMILMIAVAAPIAAVYREPQLATLVIILAFVPAIGAVGTVPVAKLQADLRFRALAVSDTSCRVSQVVLRIVFAMAGLGPIGYILPEPLAEIGRTIAYWWLAKPKIKLAAQWRRWRFLLVDSGWMFLTTNATKLAEQADKLVLGLFHAKAVVGDYYWAYMLSRQAIDMFVWNLEKILLPALSHLQSDPVRQVQAFLRAARLLAILVVPGCLLLAAMVDPVLRLLLPGGQRHESIPVVQIVSSAMSMWVIYGPTASLIKAQGRFKLLMIITWIYAVFFIAVIVLAAWLSSKYDGNGATTMAFAVGACMTVFGPIQAYIGIRPGGGTWLDVARIYIPPIILGIIAVGGGLLLASTTPSLATNHLLKVAIIAGVGSGLYLAQLRFLMPETFKEVSDQVMQLLQRRRRQ